MKIRKAISVAIDLLIETILMYPLLKIDIDGVAEVLFDLFLVAPLVFIIINVSNVAFVNQSIGKKIMGLIYVDKNGKKATRKQVLKRCLLYYVWCKNNWKNRLLGYPVDEALDDYTGTKIILKKDCKGD